MNLLKKFEYRIHPEKIIENSKLFNAEWYEKKYHIDKNEAVIHYCKTGWKEGYEPSDKFSGTDYLKMNSDINMNPLIHYELWGKKEKRLLHPASYYVLPENKNKTEGNKTIYKTKIPAKHNKCLIMATYNSSGNIADYVLYMLTKIKKSFDLIILIGDYYLNDDELTKIEGLVNYAEFSKRNYFDFGSYKTGIEFLKKNNLLQDIQELYLMNDSSYGPVRKLETILKEMREVDCDFWGMLDYYDDNIHMFDSTFYCFKNNVINDSFFLNFFDRIKENSTRDQISLDIEKDFVSYLENKFRSASYLSTNKENSLRIYADNSKPTLWPSKLLSIGYPFVRIKSLQGYSEERPEEAISIIKEKNPELAFIINKDLNDRQTEKSEIFTFDKLDNKKYISFDIFDTLIIRPFVNPVDVFHYIEKTGYGLKGFCKERVLAEQRARLNSKNEDVTLDEIYDNIVPKFKSIQSEEIKTELKLCKANPRIKALYNYAVRNKKEIVAVSDMYLPSDILMKILHNAGFTEINKVFVSCETMKSKATSTMYDYVLNELKCLPEDIIHVGDNIISDYTNAKNKGLDALKTNTIFDSFIEAQANTKYGIYWNEKYSFAGSVHLSLLANRYNHFNPKGNYYTEIGYSLGGPLVLAYLSFIETEAKLNNIDHLMFAARDGFILKKIYDEFFGDISSSYVYLTRAVVLGATLDWAKEPRYLKSILMLARKDNPKIRVYDNEVQNLKEFNSKKRTIMAWAKKNYGYLEEHLVKCSNGKENIAVVDMTTGKFTSLRGARAILGDNVKMGFFTGTFSKDIGIPYETFLKREFGPDDTPMINMSEFLISSPEESIKGYKENGPVYDEADGQDREYRYNSIIEGIRSYINDFVKRFGYEEECMMTFEEWLEFCKYYLQNKNEIDKIELKKISFSTEPVKEQEKVKI